MHGDPELKRFAHSGSLHALPDAAPKCRVEEDHIDSSIQNICGELFEIYDDGVCRKGHPYLPASSTHSVKSKDGIFEIVVVDIFDLLSEPDRLLGRPRGVRIESERIAASRIGTQLGGDGAITLKLVNRIEYSAFQLVRRESVFAL